MSAPFDEPGDWAELCTYFGGVHRELELSPVQFVVVDRLLGLSAGEPAGDDYLARTLLPALLAAMKEA